MLQNNKCKKLNYMKYNIFIVAILSIVISSCKAQVTKEEKEWLIKKTLNDLVFVRGGTFEMGDVGYIDSLGNHQYFLGRKDALPVHQVTLDSYSMGKLEVTYKEFDMFCSATGEELVAYEFRDTKVVKPYFSAVYMDWYQAKAYCQWLRELTGLPFTLATDAQWEYAARSRGKAVKYATDNGKIESGRNFSGNEYQRANYPPPGTYTPNPLGIYDMSGVSAEWVLDGWYGYTKEPQVNPVHKESGLMTIRGFEGVGTYNTVYNRGYRKPTNTGSGIGIRFVVNQKEPVDVDVVLKRLGIPPITEEEKEAFMPKNW